MKKLLVIILILAVAIINTQARDIKPVSENIKKSLSKEFTTATNIQWSYVDDKEVYRATFDFDGRELNAYFTKEGDFIGTSRYISRQQMPVVISQQLTKKYPNSVVCTIIEHTSKSETNYFITIEGKKGARMIKATPSGLLSYYKKIKTA